MSDFFIHNLQYIYYTNKFNSTKINIILLLLVLVVSLVSLLLFSCYYAAMFPNIILKHEFSHLPAEVVSGSASRLNG